MSRRKNQWVRAVAKAGDINKIIPVATKGQGLWLVEKEIDGKAHVVSSGTGKGTTCTEPIGSRKEQLVRRWAK